MSNNRIVWSGLDELKAALRSLPADLTGEATHIVEGAANSAAVAVRTIYGQHRVSGHLQDSVTVEQRSGGPFGVAMVVKSNDPIAWLFENGSQARHYLTTRGRPHATGTMWGKTPPTHAFIRSMMNSRRPMYEQLKDLVVRHGLLVTGDA